MVTSPTSSAPVSLALSGATWNTDDRSNVLAVSDGSIVQVGFDAVYGTFIVQTLPNGKYWSYSGLRSNSVAVGEHITAGEPVGSATLSLHCSLSDSVTGYKGEGNLEDPSEFLGLTPAIAVDPPAVISDIPDPGATVVSAPVVEAPAEVPTVVVEGPPVVEAPVAEAVPVEAVPVEESPVPDPGATVTEVLPTADVVVDPASTVVLPVIPPVLVPSSVNQIVADAVATPKSAAAPIAHQTKGAPMKGGLANLISISFWNDALTRGFNTFLQVGLSSVGAGATHLFTISDITALKLAGGAAAISLVQSLIRATNAPAAVAKTA